MLHDKLATFNSELYTRLTSVVVEQELMDHQAQSRVNTLMEKQRGWVLGVMADVEKCSQAARVKLQEADLTSYNNDETLRQLYTLKVLRKSLGNGSNGRAGVSFVLRAGRTKRA